MQSVSLVWAKHSNALLLLKTDISSRSHFGLDPLCDHFTTFATMASCGICLREAYDVPIPRDPNVAYAQGDVYGLKESVYTPIHDILQRTFGTGNPAYERSRKSFSDITSTADVIDNPRPAIIMDDQDDDEGEGLMVCLVTTYSNKDISELPRIFRHFSIAIASNDKMWHGYFDHLHALPEWGRENAYVIAWDFLSKATRDGAWTAQVDGKKVPQVIGRDGMSFLRVEINRRWEDWQVMCKDTKLAGKLEAELRVSAQTTYIQVGFDRLAISRATSRNATSRNARNVRHVSM